MRELWKASFAVKCGSSAWVETCREVPGPESAVRRHALRVLRKMWPDATFRFRRMVRDRKSEVYYTRQGLWR